MLRLLTVLICAILAIGCSGTSTNVASNNGNATRSGNTPATTPLPSATIDELASGRKVYQASCANCHKENGTGGEVTIEGTTLKPEDLTSAKIKGFPDEKITRIIMNGIEDDGMPAFKGKLSEAEMRDVVKFIRVELQKMPAPAGPKR